MPPLNGPGRRCGARWRSWAAVAVLVAASACAPTATLPPLAPELPRQEPEVRVGLLVDTTSVELSAPGGLEVVNPETGRVIERVPAGRPLVVTADAAQTLQLRAAPGAAPTPTGARLLSVRPAGEQLISIGAKPYRGTAVVRAAGPGRVTAINQVDMEAYLLGVVPREIGAIGDTLIEAAKAQAVAARTYAVQYLGRRAALGFDVFATVQDQVYGGAQAEHGPISRAVRETAGEILTYRGEPIEAFYHSTCAGRTAAIEEVWNEAPRPYLVSVVDVNPATGHAYDTRSSRFRWTVRWPVDSLERILSRTLADSLPAGVNSVGDVRDVRVLERTPSGRIRALRVSTTAGDFTVGGDRIRWIFLTPQGAVLNSSKFDVEVVRGAAGAPVEVVATGGGWGHGIGMCQVGAMGRAAAGQDYRTILSAYYPSTSLRELY
jgi:stage II sporulation protein D